ncbi:acyltransferase family protein [Acinetobacter johnsonii]|uniref:acyltransferase family protein n=1 Tax=Acinetobacter johnsonii TaxID=40214 RepID=UPI003F5762B1
MRNLSLDYLRIILAFMIILIHTKFLSQTYVEISYLLVNGVFRLAQPIFLIISGYFFYKVSNFSDFKIWFKRLAILYLIWTLIYFPIWFSFDFSLGFIINIFFGYFVLWYIVGVLLASLILFYIRNYETKKLIYIAFSLYSIGYIIQLVGGMHILSGLLDKAINYIPVYRNFLFKCLPFMILGFCINKINLDDRISPPFYLIIILVILTILESYINYIILDGNKGMDFLMISLIACPLLFIYFKKKKIMGKKSDFLKISIALYLIHPLVMKIYNYFNFNFNYYIFVIIFSLFFGLILVLLNRKIKYLL